MPEWCIRDPGRLRIVDEETGTVFFGCDQEWYETKWQRMSGCGPSAATNLLRYGGGCNGMKREWVRHMHEVWDYVTPTLRGVSNTAIFTGGIARYARRMEIRGLIAHSLDIPFSRENRPPLSEMLGFLRRSLEADRPVAFLNLCNGQVPVLDTWHWVTAIALEMEAEDGRDARIRFLDEGKEKVADFALWARTTTRGGGLVTLEFAV